MIDIEECIVVTVSLISGEAVIHCRMEQGSHRLEKQSGQASSAHRCIRLGKTHFIICTAIARCVT